MTERNPEEVQDTGDLVGLDDNDVTPDEVIEGDDYVEPFAGATQPYIIEED